MAALFAVLAGCAGSDEPDGAPVDAVRIGSFDFAESELMAELYARVLEREGVPVVRMGAVGPREIVAPALRQGRLDLVPEYLGSACEYEGVPIGLESLREALAPSGLTVLLPAPAEDVNVVVVTEETARREALTSISELAEMSSSLRLGGPVECPDRPHCLLGLRDVYGATFAAFVPHRDLSLTAEALVRGEVDAGIMFSTAAELSSGPFVVLRDDLGLQPRERITPVVSVATLERWPAVADLDLWSARLTTPDLQDMNRRVDDGEPIGQVAASWIESHATN